ncbi:hypothetical protein HanPI659440_Chr06g0230051 [Helianthus annuus]|uniref:Uncharacterized protein n=1 Tax=Helianthus annuus TaxID=4232 RepID=A0A251UGZ6_HELAN|nr:uncharacterized protein LOC110865069 [Helianthus annuus]KAF5801751.1 hypothetical protein HanXRQr2_Chr06g0251701 [Helianthus annuus]KAJ0572987.1 hypothetical protein HanHA89_Chr06g0221801 [Helianthus annuus]KAJ0740293.1 hypothetical protein HanOQP8_Chr06g0215261 [Helianthus annuus]KAJ0779756.1 hypothetical protein HanPI659440_Chr06g0230051 [Helianthus annuus]
MTNKSPIFTIHEPPHHFSDYGFDPQIGYFQVFEEARAHKRDSSSFRSAIDTLHFKLQKPVPRDDNKKIKKSRKRWWKNALCFFKRKRTSTSTPDDSLHRVYSGSGPLYMADSRSGHSKSSRYSGQLAGTINIPYIDLNEFNIDQTHRISATHVPIYLVT